MKLMVWWTKFCLIEDYALISTFMLSTKMQSEVFCRLRFFSYEILKVLLLLILLQCLIVLNKARMCTTILFIISNREYVINVALWQHGQDRIYHDAVASLAPLSSCGIHTCCI